MSLHERDTKRLLEIAEEIPKRFADVGKFTKEKPYRALEEALKIIKLQKEYAEILSYLLPDIDKRLSRQEDRLKHLDKITGTSSEDKQ